VSNKFKIKLLLSILYLVWFFIPFFAIKLARLKKIAVLLPTGKLNAENI
jgi:hypothetical protein